MCGGGRGVKGGGGGEEDTTPLFKTPFYQNLCFLASMNLNNESSDNKQKSFKGNVLSRSFSK